MQVSDCPPTGEHKARTGSHTPSGQLFPLLPSQTRQLKDGSWVAGVSSYPQLFQIN